MSFAKFFSTALFVIVTVMTILVSLTGAAVLVNSYGNIGFLIAPIFLLVIAAVLIWTWIKFCKNYLFPLPKTP